MLSIRERVEDSLDPNYLKRLDHIEWFTGLKAKTMDNFVETNL
jgi:hypothetical protein